MGAYSLSTLRLNRPCDGVQALSCSSVVDGAVNGLIRSQVYSLTASAGDTYLLRLLRPDASSLFRPRLDIYDQAGNPLLFLNTTDLARANFTVPADGTYTLVVTDSFDNSQSGSLLALHAAPQPSLRCRSVELRSARRRAVSPRSLAGSVYTYTAAAGESFSVRMLPD